MWAKVINVYIYHRFHYENMTWDSNQNNPGVLVIYDTL